MRVKPTVGLYGVLEATEEGGEEAGRLLSTVTARLQAEEVEVKRSPVVVSDEESAIKAAGYFRSVDPDLLVSVVVTWSFDSLHLSLLKRIPRPLAVLAVPGIRAGSIVGAHQLGSLLSELGREHSIFYGPENDPRTYRPLAAYALAAAARMRLEMGKLGFVGHRTPGMTPIAFDEVEITRRFGPLVESFGWEEIEELARAVPRGEVSSATARLKGLAGQVDSSTEAIQDSLRIALALQELARKRGIVAYGVGCYPRYAGRVCLSLAMLTEEGVPAGCEGDLNSAIVMYLLQAFSGKPAHFGEILEVNETDNSLVTSHCGCGAPSLAARSSDVSLTPVRIFHRGVCIRFPAAAAPEATFVNLTGRKDTYRMCALAGSTAESGMVFEGNPAAFRPRMRVRRLLDTIGRYGFGHHWMLGFADVVEPLARFCRLTGIEGVFPD
jgi:L-fucose isomerase-like protein